VAAAAPPAGRQAPPAGRAGALLLLQLQSIINYLCYVLYYMLCFIRFTLYLILYIAVRRHYDVNSTSGLCYFSIFPISLTSHRGSLSALFCKVLHVADQVRPRASTPPRLGRTKTAPNHFLEQLTTYLAGSWSNRIS